VAGARRGGEEWLGLGLLMLLCRRRTARRLAS
jgi:hypothetical protein